MRTEYAAPWAEPLVRRRGEVELVSYGPTYQALVRQCAAFANWAWQPPGRVARTQAIDLLRRYMRPEGEALREDVSPRELGCYIAVCERGRSLNWTARALGVSRSSVQTYLRRLGTKARRAEGSDGKAGAADSGVRHDGGSGGGGRAHGGTDAR